MWSAARFAKRAAVPSSCRRWSEIAADEAPVDNCEQPDRELELPPFLRGSDPGPHELDEELTSQSITVSISRCSGRECPRHCPARPILFFAAHGIRSPRRAVRKRPAPVNQGRSPDMSANLPGWWCRLTTACLGSTVIVFADRCPAEAGRRRRHRSPGPARRRANRKTAGRDDSGDHAARRGQDRLQVQHGFDPTGGFRHRAVHCCSITDDGI